MSDEISLYMLFIKKKNIIILCVIVAISLILRVDYVSGYFSDVFTETANSTACLSPLSIFPADDEKTIAHSHKRNNLPLYPKEVYLTFDDGPTKKNTTAILDILRESDVKASFFVIGDLAEKNKDIIKRMKDSGMSILPHSYSHDYAIYRSKDKYFSDLKSCIEVIEGVTGEAVPAFIRMPGGSDNAIGREEELRKIRKTLKDRAIRYVDWNVSSLDASANTVDTNVIVNSVINRCKNKNLAVVLMHDANTKTTTVEALPDIIRFLKKNGFVFRTFDDVTEEEEIEMIKRRIIYK
jgi:peptidoglycan/xylan/chitin deacetylase (PgdA/CDA1 family)